MKDIRGALIGLAVIVFGVASGSLIWLSLNSNDTPDKTRNWLPARKAGLHAAPLTDYEEKVPFYESEWLDNHWKTPIPPQGEKPEGWSHIETDLDPETCGMCHQQQYADWKESWHADAMGPGVVGQLLDRDTPDDRFAKICQDCHAPLTEQQPHLYSTEKVDGKTKVVGVKNPDFDPELRMKGMTCAACHVRNWQRHGSPNEKAASKNAPHGGFIPKEEYTNSRFCYRCHDFRPGAKSLNDKLIQETYGEWRRTKYAEQGIHCQDCHMPEGRHLFKGIHDPDMVKQAFTAKAELLEVHKKRLRARLTITNTGAGHRFPTYVTPQVNLVFWQVDAKGEKIEGTRKMDAVARKVSPSIGQEWFDTRLMPDESHDFEYEVSRHRDAVALHAEVEVWPDENYTIFYRIKIKNRAQDYPTTLPMLEEALDASLKSRFTAWEQQLPLN